MSKSPLSEIWFHENTSNFYTIANDFVFQDGDYPIQRFDGVLKNVNEESIKSFQAEQASIEESLKNHYESAKKALSKAMSALTQFAALTNPEGSDAMEKLFNTIGLKEMVRSGKLVMARGTHKT